MKSKILLPLLALALILPLASHAAYKKASQNVYLAPDTVHQGNYYVVGAAIEIAGTVNGDVFAAGNSLTISGIVNGDVFAAASNIRISGQVDGSVRAAASNVMIEGKVLRNIMAAGSNVVIAESSEVGRHVMLGGAVVDIRGKIGGNLEAAGNVITIANEVAGNGYFRLDQEGKLTFLGSGKIRGDLDYTAKEVMAFTSDQVGGAVNYHQFVLKPQKRLFSAAYFFGKLIQLFGLLVVGLVFITLAPKKVKTVSDLMLEKPLQQIGRGIIWFFLTPIVCVLLLITLIGIPLAVILGATYGIMLYLGKVFVALAIGLLLIKWFKWAKAPLLVSLILGAVVFLIIKSIPFLGWLAGFVAIWWAWGAIIQVKKDSLE